MLSGFAKQDGNRREHRDHAGVRRARSGLPNASLWQRSGSWSPARSCLIAERSAARRFSWFKYRPVRPTGWAAGTDRDRSRHGPDRSLHRRVMQGRVRLLAAFGRNRIAFALVALVAAFALLVASPALGRHHKKKKAGGTATLVYQQSTGDFNVTLSAKPFCADGRAVTLWMYPSSGPPIQVGSETTDGSGTAVFAPSTPSGFLAGSYGALAHATHRCLMIKTAPARF